MTGSLTPADGGAQAVWKTAVDEMQYCGYRRVRRMSFFGSERAGRQAWG